MIGIRDTTYSQAYIYPRPADLILIKQRLKVLRTYCTTRIVENSSAYTRTATLSHLGEHHLFITKVRDLGIANNSILLMASLIIKT